MKTKQEQIKAIEEAVKYLLATVQHIKSGEIEVNALQITIEKTFIKPTDN